MGRQLRIVFAAPAYWPATAFGGPVPVLRSLARELSVLGHRVDVLTTTLTGIGEQPARTSRTDEVDGAIVRYLGTPLRFRWFGVAPSLGRVLGSLPRPDVVHVFGYRDWVSTVTARWCRANGVPYVFEPLGMFAPKLRKVALKHVLDSTLYRAVPRGAALAIVASGRERQELEAVVPPERVVVRPNGFPAPYDPPPRPGPLRSRLGLDATVPLVLSVGRVARGKGLEHLVPAVASLDGVQLAIAGPDDGHGLLPELLALRDRLGVGGRVHMLGAVGFPLELYGDADVLALPSAHENFGMVAAEAAAAGTASVVSDRCGVAEVMRDRGALVIPYGEAPLRAALARLIGDPGLRAQLGRGGREVARELSWPNIVRLQAEIYERVV
jgi:glycosyltransferase involved in cell wall biosynthesis